MLRETGSLLGFAILAMAGRTDTGDAVAAAQQAGAIAEPGAFQCVIVQAHQ